MAKRMARIDGTSVVNIEYWDETKADTSVLKSVGDLPVIIGDSYRNGRFYRGADVLISPLEKENQELLAALGAAADALYEADLALLNV